MKILVFTAKDIGLNCIKYLFEFFPDDDYSIIVCEPNSQKIIDELKIMGLPATRLCENSLDKIKGQSSRTYDWLLNLWGGYIFKDDILSKAIHTLNIHPSYLPYCRGRDPVVWSLRYNYPAGVTLHELTLGVDEGPIWYQERVDYGFPCTGGELYKRVVDRCYKVFRENWPNLRDALSSPKIQESAKKKKSTFLRSDLDEDRRIDLDKNLSARSVILRLLSHDFGDNYHAEVVLDGITYSAHLSLEEKPGI